MGAKILTPFARLLQPQLCRSAVGKDRQRKLAAAGADMANFLNAAYQVARRASDRRTASCGIAWGQAARVWIIPTSISRPDGSQ